jgi:hypothetical protein
MSASARTRPYSSFDVIGFHTPSASSHDITTALPRPVTFNRTSFKLLKSNMSSPRFFQHNEIVISTEGGALCRRSGEAPALRFCRRLFFQTQ